MKPCHVLIKLALALFAALTLSSNAQAQGASAFMTLARDR